MAGQAAADHLAALEEHILADWEQRVRRDQRIPESEGMSRPALRDHIPAIFEAIVDGLRQSAPPPYWAGHEAKRPIRAHAFERLRQDYEITALLRELTHLRRAVTAALRPHDEHRVRAEELVDEAMLLAATEFDRLAREELAQEERFRDRFLAILGHDLRQPLHSVTMGASILEQLLEPSMTEQRRVATRLAQTAQRMAAMLGGLLDAVRLHRDGSLPTQPVAGVELGALVSGVLDEAELSHPNARLEFERPSAPVTGCWDPVRLAQLFSNLIHNAVDHGQPGTPVQITLRAEGALAIVSVHNENQGAPLTGEQLDHAFAPFRSDSPSGEGRHLGLGLFVARQVATAHGGSIQADSGPGGTTFRVKLPRNETPDS